MKKAILILILLLTAALLGCCGGGEGGSGETAAADPVCPVELGSTMEQASAAEPELTDYELPNCLACDKTVGGVPGKLLVYFDAMAGEPLVRSVLWNAEPEDGSGPDLYDSLYAGLCERYGQPETEGDEQADPAAGASRQALWQGTDWRVSLFYIEYSESGVCQLSYEREQTR